MHSIEHTFVRANGIRFHVARIERDAPLVLFLHGFPECWYSWRHQMQAVADAGFRAWAPDLRGYNLTSKPRGVEAYHYSALTLDVEELLNAARANRAIIVGHDWGAIVSWWFAMDYSERVEKLVIMNVPHPGKVPDGLRNPRQWLKSYYIGAFQIPYLPEKWIAKNARRMAKSIRHMATRRDAFSDEDIAQYARAIAQPDAMHCALNYYRAWVRWGIWRRIKPIDVPTLMLWGEDDVALSKELTYGTEKFVRDFRMHYIPNCGHWVQNEAAEEVNRELVQFITSNPKRA